MSLSLFLQWDQEFELIGISKFDFCFHDKIKVKNFNGIYPFFNFQS